MRITLFSLFLSLICSPLFAQQVHKCRDDSGRTVYSDKPCEGREKTTIDATPRYLGGADADAPASAGSGYTRNRARSRTLIVYGRDGCGNTRATKKKLTDAGIPFQYRLIDDPAVSDLLHRRMRERGIRVESYTLPVVEMDGTFQFNPNRAELVRRAKGDG